MDCYEFMKEDLYAEGKINQALGPLFALNKEKVAQAFLMQVELLKSMHKLIMQQIRLVEAANAMPIGWKVTKHMNVEKNNFEGRIKSMAKELNITRKCVRKESKEIEAKNKEFKLIIWLTRRGSIPHIRKGDKYLLVKRKSGINKQS